MQSFYAHKDCWSSWKISLLAVAAHSEAYACPTEATIVSPHRVYHWILKTCRVIISQCPPPKGTYLIFLRAFDDAVCPGVLICCDEIRIINARQRGHTLHVWHQLALQLEIKHLQVNTAMHCKFEPMGYCVRHRIPIPDLPVADRGMAVKSTHCSANLTYILEICIRKWIQKILDASQIKTFITISEAPVPAPYFQPD